MKKLISIMLALVFVFSMATVAFAAEGDGTTTYTDASTVTITKVYKLANSGTTSPAETFTVTQQGDGRVTDGDATSAPALGTITGATYSAGGATIEGATATITINLPQYDKVGVYEYTLKETAGNTAGVTYWTNDIKLVVTVIQQEGRVRVAAVHTETEGDKTGSIVNTYSAGSLAITKNVTGNLGDTSKYFKVTVTLTGETGKNYADSYSVTGGSYTSNPTSIKIGEATDFYLKDDDTITIANLPYGVTYTVVEADYQTTDKYDAPSYTFSDDGKKIDSPSDTVTITNNKTTNVDTGISLDSVPFILILAVCAGAAILFVTKRRSVEF